VTSIMIAHSGQIRRRSKAAHESHGRAAGYMIYGEFSYGKFGPNETSAAGVAS